MKNLWNDNEARAFLDDPIQLRVYTSRLLGREPSLVLHGGGNTSVKATARDLFENEEEVLYVKGSGWDLASIEAPGFAAVRLETLIKMAALESLSDADMVKAQRAAMIDPTGPNPSVEAILHAIIPFKYVDHTHADAVITLSNNPKGKEIINDLYGGRVLVVPYVMPGFLLAKKIYQLSRTIDWSAIEGMILMNHGVFSFADDARLSYERMIKLVTDAEGYLQQHNAWDVPASTKIEQTPDLEKLASLRRVLSREIGQALIVRTSTDEAACGFANLGNVADISRRGPLTPDHVIRTKRVPLVVDPDDPSGCVKQYIEDYHDYFQRNRTDGLTCLDPVPRWAVWPGSGTLAIGKSIKEANIIADITAHTIKTIQWGEAIGGWQALPEKDIFEVEYWELEQAKLGKGGTISELQGKVAMVTGAASGIGRACVELLLAEGACVLALDLDPDIETRFSGESVKGMICDITDMGQVMEALKTAVLKFGGLDILINNAGVFPPSRDLEMMDTETWDKSLAINLTAQQRVLKTSIPYLKTGLDPCVIFIASKNVPAPGPGQAAYSVAKAGLTQLVRIAALELGQYGIRVNAIHPNAVFDTGTWTEQQLQTRAAHYGLSVDQYKSNNVLKTTIRSADVARLVCVMAGPAFEKTTGAQLPIDGGNERVI